MKKNITVKDILGVEIKVGYTILATIQQRPQYVTVTSILDNGLLKINQQHYCLHPNKVLVIGEFSVTKY